MSKNKKTRKNTSTRNDVLTAKDVGVLLNVSSAHAYNMMKDTGKSFHLGRSRRIKRKDLEQFIEDQIQTDNPSMAIELMNPKDEE